MEEKKQIKVSLLTALLVVAIIVIIVKGALLYMQKTEEDRKIAELKNNASQMKDTISNLQGKIDTISNTINSEEETKEESVQTKLGDNRVLQNLHFRFVDVIGGVNGNVVISKDGNAYVNFYETKNDYDDVAKASFTNLQKQYQDYKIDGYFEAVAEPGESQAFNGIKLPVTDVVAAYEGYSGNGGVDGWYLYFIKNDGTISGFSIGNTFAQNNGNIKFENNINNLTNVSSIAQSITSTGRSEAHFVIAIERNGNEHILNIE